MFRISAGGDLLMANCPGILNREPRLVGILNNSIINKGGGEATSFIVEDILQNKNG